MAFWKSGDSSSDDEETQAVSSKANKFMSGNNSDSDSDNSDDSNDNSPADSQPKSKSKAAASR